MAEQVQKLPRRSRDAIVRKRPLLRPSIPSPYSNSNHQKCVYITATTPFMSAVKRTRRLLDLASKRNDAKITSAELEKSKNVSALIKERTSRTPEKICIRGTGRAIQRVMSLVLWFQEQEIYDIEIRTSSVGTIDDVEEGEADGETRSEAQIRMVSCLEVYVSYKT